MHGASGWKFYSSDSLLSGEIGRRSPIIAIRKSFVLSTFFFVLSLSLSAFPKIKYLCCVETLPAILADDQEAAAWEVRARRGARPLLLLLKGAAAVAAADDCMLCNVLSPVAAGIRPPGARIDAMGSKLTLEGGTQLCLRQAANSRTKTRGARFSGGEMRRKKIILCLSPLGEKYSEFSLSNCLGFQRLARPHSANRHTPATKSSQRYERLRPAPLLDRGAVVQRTRRERQAKQGDVVDSVFGVDRSSSQWQQRRRVQVSGFSVHFAA